jgi:NADH dehydrogenase
MKICNVLVLGGAGFIGRHVVAELARRGISVTVPTRRRDRARHLTLLPTVDVVEADIFAKDAIEHLARGKDALINLVGILHGRRGLPDERGPNNYGPDFARVHVELAQAALSACRGAGVKRFLHVSAMGAAPDAPSEYLRSKGIAEKAVLAAEDLDVTVFRPSVVFGPEDRFLNLFACMARFLPVLAIACPDARFQPVFVGDVARAMAAALDDPASAAEACGKSYGLCGPHEVTLKELVEFVCHVTGRRRLVIGLPDTASYLQAGLMELSPIPLMTRDNYYSMQVPSVCEGPFPFGIQPQSLEAVAPTYLAPHGPRERFPELRWRARR